MGVESVSPGEAIERDLEPDDVVDLVAVDSSERLERLRPLFEDARVVLLGEANHGDGASRQAMATLVEFLHADLGFEVLAAEAGLYDCGKAWKLARRGGSAAEVAATCAGRVYRDSKPMRQVWEYVVAQADAEVPLILAGFDNRPTGHGRELIDDLASVLAEHGALGELKPDWRENLEDAVAMLRELPPRLRSTEERAGQRAGLLAPLEALRSAASADALSATKWVRILEGLLAREQDFWLYHEQGRVLTDDQFNLRDEQLAGNLVWLLTERYPDKRVVVWAGGIHNVFNVEGLGRLDHFDHVHEPDVFLPMAERLLDHLPREQIVSMMFLGIEGERGLPGGQIFTLPEPPADSFEAAAAASSIDYGLVDLTRFRGSDHWLGEAFSSAALGVYHEAIWASHLDAIAFIRTMTPNYAIDD